MDYALCSMLCALCSAVCALWSVVCGLWSRYPKPETQYKEKGNPIELPLTVFMCKACINLAFRWFATAACKRHAISAFFL